jgi:predicted amino acid dehydrogenase
MFFESLLKGFDFWLWGTLLIVAVITCVVIAMKDMHELRTQQELMRNKEGYYVTIPMLNQMLIENNKNVFTRFRDALKEANSYVVQSGQAVPLAHQLFEQQLTQSIQTMEVAIGEPSKEREALAEEIYADQQQADEDQEPAFV